MFPLSRKGLTGQYISDHEMTEKFLDFQSPDMFRAEYFTVFLTFSFIKLIQTNLIFLTQTFVSPTVEIFFKIINRLFIPRIGFRTQASLLFEKKFIQNFLNGLHRIQIQFIRTGFSSYGWSQQHYKQLAVD